MNEPARFCPRCGRPEGSPSPDREHAGCRAALALEPPRYCPACRRRMVVQVRPTGWTATCSRHGPLTSLRA